MSAKLPRLHVQNDDSEDDDPDFVPPAAADAAGDSGSSDSESEARNAKKQKVDAVAGQEDLVKKQEARAKLWEEFQASVSTPPPKKQPEAKSTVKVVKRYRFAGEDVTKVVEVLQDSEDAKKWPLYDAQASPSPVASSSGTPQPEPQLASSSSSASLSRPARAGAARRQRKSLDAMFATAKAKKLTTIDKSAMDWHEHVQSSTDVKDDLEAHRRGGGYLEKVEFLQRVDERKEAERDRVASKRRRG